MGDNNRKGLEFLETVCVFAWFLMDGFWLFEFKRLLEIVSCIALGTGILIFFCYLLKDKVSILVAGADTSWIFTNALWASGDLTKIASRVAAAKVFFCIGLALFVVAGIVFFRQKSERLEFALLLRRLRVLHLVTRQSERSRDSL